MHDKDGGTKTPMPVSAGGVASDGRRKLLKTVVGVGAVVAAPAIWTSAARAQNRTLVVRDPAVGAPTLIPLRRPRAFPG